MPENGLVRYDTTLKSLREGLVVMASRAQELDLRVDGVEFDIQRMVAQAQKARDLALDRMNREAEPYAAPLAEVKKRWKPVVDGFDDMFKSLKRMAGTVLQRQREEADRKRREAEAKLEAARRAADKGGKQGSLMDLREARKAVDALPPPGAPIGVKSETGTLSGREVWKFELQDINQVPDAYVKRELDTKKVDFAIKNGARNIPGLRIYPDIEMVARRAPGGK